MRLLLFISTLFLTSCSNSTESEKQIQEIELVDSIIFKSQKVLENSHKIQKISDSISTITIHKTASDLRDLNGEIERYKQERIMLINELKVTKENFRIDTVFIETKRNFWGKEKRTISSNSDSFVQISTDSLQSEIRIPDSSNAYDE